MTMTEWHPNRKRRFRGEVLLMLAGRHNNQQHRMDDVHLYRALQSVGAGDDMELRDVVTILQEMKGRGWVNYEQLESPITKRIELHRVEICPDGQDLVDQSSHHPSVSFR